MANRRFSLINRPNVGSSAEINDLTAAVTWANVPDANITESSVTQHEAALTILESQITDGSILARLGSAETITGIWSHNADVNHSAGSSSFWFNGGNTLSGELAVVGSNLTLTNNGLTDFVITGFTDVQIDGDIELSNTSPSIRVSDTNAATDQKNIDVNFGSGVLGVNLLNDARDSSSLFITMSRSGTTPTVFSLFANDINLIGSTIDVSGALTASSYGGITEANLVDKSANEAITGQWDFQATTDITLGALFRIWDATNTDNIAFQHDGTDLNITGTTTTDINITGITAIQAGTVDADFDAITATSYGGITEAALVDKGAAETISGVWSFNDTMNVANGNGKIIEGSDLHSATMNIRANRFNFIELGVIGNTSNVEEPVMRSQGGHTEFYVRGTRKFAINETGTAVTVEDGYGFRVQDTLDTDYIQIAHDGTDVNFTHVNTTDWNITGITSVQAGTVDVDFAVITGSYFNTPTSTTTALADITAAINTDAGKVAGSMVFNTTSGAPVWAAGNADGSVWVDATGTTAHTPV